MGCVVVVAAGGLVMPGEIAVLDFPNDVFPDAVDEAGGDAVLFCAGTVGLGQAGIGIIISPIIVRVFPS